MTPPAPPTPPRAGARARAQILDAAIRCLVRHGVAGASMAAIASEGGVSKALLHYHYADRSRLMAEAVRQLGRRIVARERSAMDTARGSGAVDALWGWLDGELSRGELHALLELAMQREDEVQDAASAVATLRHRAAAQTVEQLFADLELTPRMPAALLGAASVAFVDGLAVGVPSPARDSRVSFDLFWLALLSLAE